MITEILTAAEREGIEMSTFSSYRGRSTVVCRFTAAVLIIITILLLSFSITDAAPINGAGRGSTQEKTQQLPVTGAAAPASPGSYSSVTEKTQKLPENENPALIVSDSYSNAPSKSKAALVSKATESTDLTNFLKNAVISGATQDDQGRYLVVPGQEYQIALSFGENPFQFDNHADLTYQLPEGITVPSGGLDGELNINIVYRGQTYTVKADYELTDTGELTVRFRESDPNFHFLEQATNVSFRYTFSASFDGSETELEFSDTITKELIFDDEPAPQAYVNKSAEFDPETGRMDYTITVTADGYCENVNVTDTISGNALAFNNDVQISGNSTTPSGGPDPAGFNYTFPSMQDGETITITYSAKVNFNEDSDDDSVITADQTKNTVTVQPEGGDPHTAEYSQQITFKTINKLPGTIAESGPQHKIVDWTIWYNNPPLVSAAGDKITDTIDSNYQDIMRYHGQGITVEVYNQTGQLIETRNIRYDELPSHNDSTWTYQIPASDTALYSYKITYQTRVNMQQINTGGTNVTLSNTAISDHTGPDSDGVTVGPSSEVAITKSVESSSTTEVTWVSTINVPEEGLDSAVVTDTLPSIWLNNQVTYDDLVEGSVQVTGLLPGESYVVSAVYYDASPQQYKFDITFYKNEEKTEPGIKRKSPRWTLDHCKFHNISGSELAAIRI